MLVAGIQHQPEILYEDFYRRQRRSNRRRACAARGCRTSRNCRRWPRSPRRPRAVSAPALAASAIASAAVAMCTPAKSWFTVFTSEPMPGASPSRNTLAEVAARIDLGAGEGLGGAGGHEGELARFGAGASARHRRVEKIVARPGEPLAERPGEGRRHGGALHDEAALVQRGYGAAFAIEHRLDLLGVHHGNHDHVGGRGGFGRCRGNSAASRGEGLRAPARWDRRRSPCGRASAGSSPCRGPSSPGR